MGRPQRCSEDEIADQLRGVPDWERDGSRIRRTVRLDSFVEAFAFMTKVAFVAEALNHHPEWSNVYATVSIELTTHDVDGLSELDFEFARQVDALLG